MAPKFWILENDYVTCIHTYVQPENEVPCYLFALGCGISHLICLGTVRHNPEYSTIAAASMRPNPK